MPLMKKIAIWACVVVAVCGVIFAVVYEPDFSNEYVAVTARGSANFQLDHVTCVSIDSRHGVIFDEQEYPDPKLSEAISQILSIKNVMFDVDNRACPWSFSITGITGTIYAVRYNDRFAKYLVSLGVCTRSPNGLPNPNDCVEKNIYVFNPRLPPHQLFLVALTGLAKLQVNEWEAFQVRK